MTATTGRFWGVGVGPGDPELITRKGARLIGQADVIAFHAGVGKESNARRIAAVAVPGRRDRGAADLSGHDRRAPTTRAAMPARSRSSTRSPPRGSRPTSTPGATSSCSPRVTRSSTAPSCTCTTAWPSAIPTEIVPGVPAFAAAAAAAASPLVRQTDVLTVLPGTLPEPELARRLADTDAAIIMKLGRTFPAVRRALAAAGRLDHAVYVERASMPEQRWLPVAEVEADSVPYFSLIVVTGDSRNGLRSRTVVRPGRGGGRGRRARRRAARRRARARPGRLADARGQRGAGRGRPRRRLRAVRRPRAPARGPDPARLRQHGRGRPRPGRARPRQGRREGRRRVRRRRRGLRDGGCRLRGGRGCGVRRRVDPRPARSQRRAGRGGAGRRPDRRRLRGRLALRPAQAVGGGRAAAARDRRGRPGAGDLQPGLALAHRAGRDRAAACCSSTASPTPWSSSAATSAAPRSR